jgi:hypothetical protein
VSHDQCIAAAPQQYIGILLVSTQGGGHIGAGRGRSSSGRKANLSDVYRMRSSVQTQKDGRGLWATAVTTQET